MILTDSEMKQVRRTIEAQAGLDEELLRRCGPMIHMDKLDEAVRSAFVLLEERLREMIDGEGMTGTRLANTAFNPDKGPLARQLGHTQAEREGLRELYSGAFKLFRNPTAHGVVGYSAAEGKAIIGLVNLMLKMLERAEKMPAPGSLPEKVEEAVDYVARSVGAGAASRLRAFVGKCLELELTAGRGKHWIPFKRYAFVQYKHWDEPKQYRIPLFYLHARESNSCIMFPTNNYYTLAEGLDIDPISDELAELGFRPSGSNRNPTVDLATHNDQAFFDALFDLVVRVADEFEETLDQA
jgi:uncharacterized protein (TIGR02391 family)